MEEAQWLPPTFANRKYDVPVKTLTGNSLSARCIGSQATEVAIRVGIVNHMVTLARPQSVRIS
jgi:hypothetical protein